MRPFFTVHAGEYIVGEHIERSFSSLNVWIPAKDSGIDLLVTDAKAQKAVSLQVKMSRDYRSMEAFDDFDRSLIAAGWVTIERSKLERSIADWWVFVLVSHERKSKPQFIVIPPKKLLQLLSQTHGIAKRYDFYPRVTSSGQCFDGRGMTNNQCVAFAAGRFKLGPRNLQRFLNNWWCLEKLETIARLSRPIESI